MQEREREKRKSQTMKAENDQLKQNLQEIMLKLEGTERAQASESELSSKEKAESN